MKKAYIFIAFLACFFLLVPRLEAQGYELVVGGTNTSSNYVPLYGARAADASFHSQMIYPADSLTAMVDKYIDGLDFYTKNAAAAAFDSRFEVRLATVQQDAFANSTLIDNINFTTVFSGNLDATGELMTITFGCPYDYRGGNLIVDVTVGEAGTVSGACSFKGSSRTASSIMRCTGIAGRYPFMPRARFHYSDIVQPSREGWHTTTDQLCKGSTGDYYEWHLTLRRADESLYDTVINHVDLRSYTFSGDDTTVTLTQVMPRNLVGCADTERLDITIYRPLSHFVYDTICQFAGTYAEHGLNIEFDGHTTGTRTYLTPQSEWGRVYDVQCFDTTYLMLTINRSYNLSRSLNICSSRLHEDDEGIYYMYGNHRIEVAEVPTDVSYTMDDTLRSQTVNGCDSTLILHITVSPSSRTDTTVYARESELPYTVMGVTFTYASTRSRMLYNQYNCDSIVGITLVLKPTYRDTTYVTGCGDYDWVVAGSTVATISHDTIASQLLTSSDGLDSVVYLRYTTGTINRADTVVTACDSYTFRGVEYTSSDNVYDTVPGIGMECDTQYAWHIRINHPVYKAESAVVCDSLVWNGSVYRESTDDVYLYTANECENADTLHLLVKYSTIGDTLVYAPQSYIYYDSTYTATGDYVYVIQNGVGCDSIVTLHLFVTPQGTPMPQLYAYGKNVLILNHYPFGDNTRVEYDSIYWEHDGQTIDGFHDDTYHLDNYDQLSGCYKVWTMIEGTWFPTNEICISNAIDEAAGLECRVWPNPVEKGGRLNVEVSGQWTLAGSRLSVDIVDMEGRVAASVPVDGSSVTFNCNLERGSYIMTLRDSKSKAATGGKRIVVY